MKEAKAYTKNSNSGRQENLPSNMYRFSNGKKHDFRLFKKSKILIHPKVEVITDTGYQGTPLSYSGVMNEEAIINYFSNPSYRHRSYLFYHSTICVNILTHSTLCFIC